MKKALFVLIFLFITCSYLHSQDLTMVSDRFTYIEPDGVTENEIVKSSVMFFFKSDKKVTVAFSNEPDDIFTYNIDYSEQDKTKTGDFIITWYLKNDSKFDRVEIRTDNSSVRFFNKDDNGGIRYNITKFGK